VHAVSHAVGERTSYRTDEGMVVDMGPAARGRHAPVACPRGGLRRVRRSGAPPPSSSPAAFRPRRRGRAPRWASYARTVGPKRVAGASASQSAWHVACAEYVIERERHDYSTL